MFDPTAAVHAKIDALLAKADPTVVEMAHKYFDALYNDHRTAGQRQGAALQASWEIFKADTREFMTAARVDADMARPFADYTN